MTRTFKDRTEAGRLLAEKLRPYAHRSDVVVLALPRGGVPVAYEVAKVLEAPLNIFLVRKLGVPGQEELAMGAIASGGMRVLNHEVLRSLDISREQIEAVARREQQELERRERAYRGNRPPPRVKGHTVILVDDGIATGSSLRAAVQALRQREPLRVVVAAPVAPLSTFHELREEMDDVVCVSLPDDFHAIGAWYDDFPQLNDQEVRDLLGVGSPAP